MEQLFQCNDVDKEKQGVTFLTLIGGEVYNVLKYRDLKDVLLNHYCFRNLVPKVIDCTVLNKNKSKTLNRLLQSKRYCRNSVSLEVF